MNYRKHGLGPFGDCLEYRLEESAEDNDDSGMGIQSSIAVGIFDDVLRLAVSLGVYDDGLWVARRNVACRLKCVDLI